MVEHEKRPSARYFPDASVTLFKRLNMILPMAPMVDVSIMHEWLKPVRSGELTMLDLMSASLSPAQQADIASATNLIHASRHIPFLIKGQEHVVKESDRQTLHRVAGHMVQEGFPPEKPGAYRYDAKRGAFMIAPDSFMRSLGGTRKRLYRSILGFMRDTGVYAPTKPDALEHGLVNIKNSTRIQAFLTDERFAHSSRQYVRLMEAIRSVIDPHTIVDIGKSQSRHYDLSKGGKAGFRVTPEIAHLTGHITQAVQAAWQEEDQQTRIRIDTRDRMLTHLVGTALV